MRPTWECYWQFGRRKIIALVVPEFDEAELY
jgi:hypothetical protein